MKKVLMMVMAAAMIFAVAGSASAAALETKGEFRARGWYLDNYFANKESSDFFDQRLRVFGKWPISETAGVAFRADILEGFWGEATKGKDKLGTEFDTSSKQAQIAFDQVYAWFTLPETPVMLTVGRQDVSWGPGLLAQADPRDRFKAVVKFDPVVVGLSYDKNAEVEPTAAHLLDTGNLNDNGGFTLSLSSSAAGWKFGGLVAYGKNMTDASKEATRITGDVFMMGKGGPLDLKAEAIYQAGKDDLYAAGAQDVDVAAYAAYLGASMTASKATIGLEAIYVSGNDLTTADKNEGTLRQDYQGPFSSIILFNNLDYNGFQGETLAGASDVSVGNAMAAKASVSMSATDKVSVSGAAIYAARLEDTATAKADPLGIEIDLGVSYTVTDAIKIMLGAGYLMAGDFYGDIEDPWGVMVGTVVNF